MSMWNKLFKRKSSKSNNKDNVKDSSQWRDTAKRGPGDQTAIGHPFDSTPISRPISSVIPELPTALKLEPCQICKRTFVPATLEKHIGICEKMQMRKRNIFDSSQKRREGTELEKYSPIPPPKQQSPKLTIGLLRPRRSSTSSTSSQKLQGGTTGEFVRKRSIREKPVSEQCQYCGRHFCERAYDRHVEWCKEKAVLRAHETSKKDSAEKQKLNARISYRAPSLRTKRGLTRGKYSPFEDVFMKSFMQNKSKSRSEAGRSLSNSMTSSIISEGGFSDKYDPFISAKRQFEELFAPNVPEPEPQSSLYDRSPGPKVTRRTQTLAEKPSPVTSTPLRKVTASKVIKPSSVQSGITDDGPISSNFLSPEEFDETPVRSVYSPVLRNRNATPNRRTNRNILGNLNLPAISKTDSLAAFLNYEKHLGLSEKDLKDTNNMLNQHCMRTTDEDDVPDEEETSRKETRDEEEEEDEKQMEKDEVNVEDPHFMTIDEESLSPNQQSLSAKQTESSDSKNSYSFRMEAEKEENERLSDENQVEVCFINQFDNLSLKQSKVTLETCVPILINDPIEEQIPKFDCGDGLSRSERRVHLKRQMKLQLDNILYDTTPPTSAEVEGSMDSADDPNVRSYFEGFDLEAFIDSFEDDEKNPIFKGYKEMKQNLESDSEEDGHCLDSSYGSLICQSTLEKEKDEPSSVSHVKLPRFCPECGFEFLAQAKFCMECGVKRAYGHHNQTLQYYQKRKITYSYWDTIITKPVKFKLNLNERT